MDREDPNYVYPTRSPVPPPPSSPVNASTDDQYLKDLINAKTNMFRGDQKGIFNCKPQLRASNNDYMAAVNLLQRYIDDCPLKEQVHAMMLMAYSKLTTNFRKLDKRTSALEYVKKYYDLCEKDNITADPLVYYNHALVLMNMEEYDSAKEKFNLVKSLKPQMEDHINEKLKDIEDAKALKYVMTFQFIVDCESSDSEDEDAESKSIDSSSTYNREHVKESIDIHS